MNVLIIKLGATGDVVRTSPLLRRIDGRFTWVTTAKNRVFLEGLPDVGEKLRVLAWEERAAVKGEYFDLVINLEDDLETAGLLQWVSFDRLFGAFARSQSEMAYTEDARRWFDLSLISTYGRERADQLKIENRSTYQELIFDGLGLQFSGEKYLLPETCESGLRGDVAIATEAGAVWPMKRWAHYGRLKEELEGEGLRVNLLPARQSLLEHLADVRGHRCLVSGDSLPMHLSLGSGIKTVSLFNCTSPWEIYDYGILSKVISPLLADFFYKRGCDTRATSAISLDEVRCAVLKQV